MDKLENLKNILKQMDSALVAYSGGVDSTFLLKISHDVLKDKVLAVTAESETYTKEELEKACETSSNIGVKHLVIHTNELLDKNFSSNPSNRCYFCKKELFSKLKDLAIENKINYILDGTNLDDSKDHRPGKQAALEFGVRSPLNEANLTKNEIREYSKTLGLATWDKPSQACLSSRFPYGEFITNEKINIVSSAEIFLKDLGFKNIRVRYYETKLARIEVLPSEIEKITSLEIRLQIISYLKNLGIKYITIDLEGFRSGSMNEVL